MIKSLMEGEIFNLRPSIFYSGDLKKYWRQLKRNRITDPHLNGEFTRTTSIVEYSQGEFKFKSTKTQFGDHALYLESLILENLFKCIDSNLVTQIIAAFIECVTRKYMEGEYGIGTKIDSYIRLLKKRILNPRIAILEEMSDDRLAEVERNMIFISQKQKQEAFEAFASKYLLRYIEKIHLEQKKRRDIILSIPSPNTQM